MSFFFQPKIPQQINELFVFYLPPFQEKESILSSKETKAIIFKQKNICVHTKLSLKYFTSVKLRRSCLLYGFCCAL